MVCHSPSSRHLLDAQWQQRVAGLPIQAWHATHTAFPAVTCSAPLPPFTSLLTNLAPCEAAAAQADPHRALPATQLAWVVLSCPLHAYACVCPCTCAACCSLQGERENPCSPGSLTVPGWGGWGCERAQLCTAGWLRNSRVTRRASGHSPILCL